MDPGALAVEGNICSATSLFCTASNHIELNRQIPQANQVTRSGMQGMSTTSTWISHRLVQSPPGSFDSTVPQCSQTHRQIQLGVAYFAESGCTKVTRNRDSEVESRYRRIAYFCQILGSARPLLRCSMCGTLKAGRESRYKERSKRSGKNSMH